MRALAAHEPFDPAFETRLREAGAATCAALRDAAGELGVCLLACDAALRLESVGALHAGVRVAGMATFLAELGGAPVISF